MIEVLVVGGGPAGLAAAREAAAAGARATLVDDNPEVGGQIWRGAPPAVAPEIQVRRQTRVVDQPAPGVLRAEAPQGIVDLPYEALVLATGARERFLPFPGWTLPHVLGAGGLQAMVKGGLPIAGRRVVVAGTGPLRLAVAAYLRQHGAEITAVCDQAPWRAVAAFAAALPPGKIREGIRLGRALRGVPVWMNAWPVEAHAGGVVIRRNGRRRALACDYLACGFHLVPNLELPVLLGCATQNGCVVVNERQETTVPGVYCAGEPTGIGGVELAEIEGALAGRAAAGEALPMDLLARRETYRRFAGRLSAVCALRPELRALPQPETFVCRCEDVSWARLREHTTWRAAKLHTRCGMGPCQGRVCGPACEFLLGWPAESVRPPVFPALVAALARE